MWHTFFFSFPGCVILQSVTDRSQQQQPHWKSNSNKYRKPKHTCLASQLEKDPLKPGAATSSSFLQMFPIPTRKNTFFIDAVKLLFLSWDTEEDVTPSRNAEVVFGQRGDRRKDLDTAKKPRVDNEWFLGSDCVSWCRDGTNVFRRPLCQILFLSRKPCGRWFS